MDRLVHKLQDQISGAADKLTFAKEVSFSWSSSSSTNPYRLTALWITVHELFMFMFTRQQEKYVPENLWQDIMRLGKFRLRKTAACTTGTAVTWVKVKCGHQPYLTFTFRTTLNMSYFHFLSLWNTMAYFVAVINHKPLEDKRLRCLLPGNPFYTGNQRKHIPARCAADLSPQ